MSAKIEPSRRKLVLVSDDEALIGMAKGAIASGESMDFIVVQKNIQAVGAELRDMAADAIVLDMDAGKVADFEQLQKIKRMTGANCAIIVVTSNFTPAAARILIQLKVADFLVKPLQTSDLVRACNNALKQPGEDHQVEPQFLAFMPASGGVGTTVLALETAHILNRYCKKLGRTTCVVDLNFQHGSCAEYLDIEPRFDITEIENAPERLDRQLLDVMLSKHASGLSLIAAPNQPSEMRTFKAALVVRLLDLVSAYFDYVVIDLPRIWFPWTDTVIMGSNRLFVVADMTVPSIRHARRLHEVVGEKVGTQVNAKILVNRMDRRSNAAGLNARDVEDALGDHFAGGIPNNYRLVRDAVDRGVPLEEIEVGNNVTQELSRIILADAAEVSSAREEKKGLFSRGRNLFTRKAGWPMANRFSALQTKSYDDEIFGEGPKPVSVSSTATAPSPAPVAAPVAEAIQPVSGSREKLIEAKVLLHRRLLEEFNLVALEKLPRDALVQEIRKFVTDYVTKERLALNNAELEEFVGTIVDEMTGLGPLEALMRNPEISDILINGHKNCYAEIKGVLQPVVIPFKDEAHLLRVVNKIVAAVGRRIDESNPMCDARMADGSRFNAAIRPIAIDGPLVSIRKFSKNKLSLEKLVEFNAVAPQMAEVLRHAVAARMTTIISGGTGTGKTTMLNALSAYIGQKERVITIEDAAELALQIPHVGRMETRPSSNEGTHEIKQRDLVKNALRMRPDRVILGECRGEEAFDMLQAMNTGHEGSMATIHANTPRDAISRLEQMLGMTGMPMTVQSIRSQTAGAIHLIVQLTRLSDGKRKITSIAEVTGMEGDIIQMQEIFKYKRTGMGPNGEIQGHFEATGVRPRFLEHLVAMGIRIPGSIFEPGIELK